MKDHHHRTLAKTLSRRLVATGITITLVYLFTGQLALATTIGLLEMVTKLLAYYLHERARNATHRGRASHPDRPNS